MRSENSRRGKARPLLRLTCAAGCARLAYRVLTSRPPGGAKAWTRTNHRDEPVTLLEGPAAAAGATWSVLTVPGLPAGERFAMAAAGLGAAAVGCYDDLAGSGDRRGFRGHLGALAHGEVTTGAVKLLGVGAAGLVAAIALSRDSRPSAAAAPLGLAAPGSAAPGSAAPGSAAPGSAAPGSAALGSAALGPGRLGAAVDVVINTGLVAGSANLLNLFDLRPGRAIKVLLLASGALAVAGAGDSIAAPAGAAIALLPDDLGERSMLGDAGANALGAMAGVAAASSLSRRARLGVLAGLVGLTAASEKISFTKVIARTRVLNRLDQFGRRPSAPPVHADAGRPEGGAPLAGTGPAGTGLAGAGPADMAASQRIQ